MEEEEMAKLEDLCAPNGGGGLAWDKQNGLQFDNDPPPRNNTPSNSNSRTSRSFYPTPSSSRSLSLTSQGRPLSRLVAEAQSKQRPHSTQSAGRPTSRLISEAEQAIRNKVLPPSPPRDPPAPISTDPSKWACPQCTLLNPLDYLSCEACGLEQPPQPIPHHKRYGPGTSSNNLPKPPPASALRGPGATPFEPAKGRIGWNCLHCGTFMENEWWTCTLCGTMKADS
jgi:RNA polymerase subunit RPABC4/transcription elongation factor Spt4